MSRKAFRQFLCSAEMLVRAALFDALRPEPMLSVAEWAGKHRRLPAKGSPFPGRWDNERTPYLIEPMECLSSRSPYRDVVVMKGTQVGFTESGYNWVGYTIDFAPCAMMIVQPTVDLAKRNSKLRIQPMIDETPRLQGKVKTARSRDSGNTVLLKEFDGGLLLFSGANSAVALRNQPIQNLFLDEIDGYPLDLDEEGDPVTLAEKRTGAYPRAKRYYVSTPKVEETSRIKKLWEKSDKRRYHIPCPFCGHLQWLKWKQLKWPPGKPKEVKYICEKCEQGIDEHHKNTFLRHVSQGGKAEWIPENPGAQDGEVAGFHLSQLYSPYGWKGSSWPALVRQWEEAQGSPEMLRGFCNTALGEPWRAKGEAPKWQALFHMREEFKEWIVPRGAGLVTGGADVQKDRIELELVAWGPRRESWSIAYVVLEGDTDTDEPWNKLTDLIAKEIPREGGGTMPIRLVAVDAGYRDYRVYAWLRKQPREKAIAVKGFETVPYFISLPSKMDLTNKGKRIRRGLTLWKVGTNISKDELYSCLKLERPTDPDAPMPSGYCHFPKDRQEEYFKQLTGEEMVVTQQNNGRRKIEWQRIYGRVEALDCRVYARAAAAKVGIDRFGDSEWAELLGARLEEISKPRPLPTEGAAEKRSEEPKPAMTETQARPRRSTGYWRRHR